MSETPLFPPGLHDIGEPEFENHFLSEFPASQSRHGLVVGLRGYIAELRSLGVRFELWLDGSFTTTKRDPADVDMVVFASPADMNLLDPARQVRAMALFDRLTVKQRFGCDVLFCGADSEEWRSYWRGWYGFDRSERPKGIARLVVQP